tara:strand:+ start:909 stop:1361 length:453 start_codon:yes stop_codon:yes gene_type:complete
MINGEFLDFSSLKGKKVLIVNTASYCGLTSQYKDLESLYKKYKDSGFEILAFPSNNFGKQEPGTNNDIATFCESNYSTSFILMSKIEVKGKNIHPVYRWLTKKELNGVKSSSVKWNFQKYLIDENGNFIEYYNPYTSPKSKKITNWIEGI